MSLLSDVLTSFQRNNQPSPLGSWVTLSRLWQVERRQAWLDPSPRIPRDVLDPDWDWFISSTLDFPCGLWEPSQLQQSSYFRSVAYVEKNQDHSHCALEKEISHVAISVSEGTHGCVSPCVIIYTSWVSRSQPFSESQKRNKSEIRRKRQKKWNKKSKTGREVEADRQKQTQRDRASEKETDTLKDWETETQEETERCRVRKTETETKIDRHRKTD